ncbi:carboxylesterase/lipase family protein [Streptomyces sp. NPDC053079]|uniref:carboxylesterase/lipase family protein n=1 Tax=Streptomyces sp. NPDC053079 TaxID=3365697 RepID=UPI0037D47B99
MVLTRLLRRGGVLGTLLLALGPLVTCPAASAADVAPVVTTDRGPVRGTAHGSYATYEGIPYAQPPTGPLRWRAPVPARRWTEVRDATRPGPRCVQLPFLGAGGAGSEDCLYLNVTAPTGPAPARGRPVMVWLHGGAFIAGAGDPYDARRLVARGDVVVVTLNYRLGVFGLFGHPELGGAPDFTLADQRAALRWVRANAARFGGDPRDVTVFGESAGALSICALLTSPSAAGLFHKAALQSGSCMTSFPRGSTAPGSPQQASWPSQQETSAAGAAAARRLGCTDAGSALRCLRALPAERLATTELMPAFSHLSYGGELLPRRPDRALEEGRFHRMPVLQGTNHDEMRFFVGLSLAAHPVRDERDYRARLADSFGDAAGAVEARYPAAAFPTPALAWATVLTDRTFTCTTFRAGRALAAHVPVYGFEFSDPDAPRYPGLPPVEGFPYGAAHGSELPYLFPSDAWPPLSAAQLELAATMAGYWTGFARTGVPATGDGPPWPLVSAGDTAPVALDLRPGPGGIRPVDTGAVHHCGFWAAHGA